MCLPFIARVEVNFPTQFNVLSIRTQVYLIVFNLVLLQSLINHIVQSVRI